MKIAIVFEIFYPTVNGVITSSVNLAENLIDRGHEVIFIAPKWEQSQDRLIRGRIPVFYIASTRNWAYPGMRNVLPWNRGVEVLLRREGVDVVHITGPWLLTLAVLRAAGRLGIPAVHTFHTMLHEKSYILYFVKTPLLVPLIRVTAWKYYRMFVDRCEISTAPSRMAVRQLQARFPDEEVHFVSNGVDVERFEDYASLDELRRAYPAHNDTTFLFVGRLGQEKSVDEIIMAMRQVVDAVPRARLLIVGDGPSAARYRALTHQLGLSRAVRFLGRIPHEQLLSSGLFHHSHAFVTASTTENQPMTVIEAICCGLPVVVPDVPGITELVDGNGARFRPHSVDSLAAALIRLAQDRGMRDRLAARSVELIERFDGRNVADRFIELYSAALERSRQAEPALATSVADRVQ